MLTLDLRHVSANDSAVAGQVSNFATVAMTVTFIAVGRTANRDDFALLKNTSRTYNVVANEITSVGTTINPASVVIATARSTVRLSRTATVP
jgi:hypothetical protein